MIIIRKFINLLLLFLSFQTNVIAGVSLLNQFFGDKADEGDNQCSQAKRGKYLNDYVPKKSLTDHLLHTESPDLILIAKDLISKKEPLELQVKSEFDPDRTVSIVEYLLKKSRRVSKLNYSSIIINLMKHGYFKAEQIQIKEKDPFGREVSLPLLDYVLKNNFEEIATYLLIERGGTAKDVAKAAEFGNFEVVNQMLLTERFNLCHNQSDLKAKTTNAMKRFIEKVCLKKVTPPDCFKREISPMRNRTFNEESEQLLLTGRPEKVTSTKEVLKVDDVGTNESYFIDFDNKSRGVFKPTHVPANDSYSDEKIEREDNLEVASYKIDKMLGFQLVPPTFERSFVINNVKRTGSAQLFVNGKSISSILGKRKGSWSIEEISNSNNESNRLFFLDYLLGNCDRHENNVIVDPSGTHLMAIDNGLAFNKNICDIRRKQVMRGELNTVYFNLLATFVSNPPPDVVEKLSQVSEEEIVREFSSILSQGEISSLLYRRHVVLKYCGYEKD